MEHVAIAYLFAKIIALWQYILCEKHECLSLVCLLDHLKDKITMVLFFSNDIFIHEKHYNS